MASSDPELDIYLTRASEGCPDAWKELVTQYTPRLKRMIHIRLDDRLSGRVDASDVIQDVLLQASHRLSDYLNDPQVPFYVWLRTLTIDRIGRLHRFHLSTQARDVKREISLAEGAMPEVSSGALAHELCRDQIEPPEEVIRREQIQALQRALEALDPLDREVLTLRHFELLTSAEVALILNITAAAAAKRYFRAVRRLRDTIDQFPGSRESWPL
jgi:RNA polymerase sigma-70 factor, ECF subfamily